VADIFHEVDEEVRREQLKQLWNRYGNVAVGVALLILVGVGGWRLYGWWEAKRAAEAGGQFEAAALLSEDGKHKDAEAVFAKIASQGSAGYRTLARLRAAEELSRQDGPAAVKAYDEIANDKAAGQAMQDLANVRAALILLDSAPYEDLRSRLEPVAAEDRAFHHTARELLALAAWRSGNQAATRHWIDIVMRDSQTPASIRGRVQMLMALTAEPARG
jgi:hypothetical protein